MHIRFLCTLLISVAVTSTPCQSAKNSKINLHRALGSDYACAVYRPIQFISEDELLFLAGPTSNCYQQVDKLSLVVISLDRRIIARKEWPSTFPGLVIAPKRIALTGSELLILDDHLETIQSFPLPNHRGFPVLSISQEGLFVDTDGGSLICEGLPLKCSPSAASSQTSRGQLIYRFADGRQLKRKGGLLVEQGPGDQEKVVANLSWVAPACEKYEYCQSYDAGTGYQVATGSKKRVLIMSNGSRFPVTDAAGLFPYFRVQIFDLSTGSEIFREEDVTKTAHRSAALSPDGDLLATFDGNSVVVHQLR